MLRLLRDLGGLIVYIAAIVAVGRNAALIAVLVFAVFDGAWRLSRQVAPAALWICSNLAAIGFALMSLTFSA